jgi:hypothetical protein
MLEQLLDLATRTIAPMRDASWKVISRVHWLSADEGMMREEPPVLDGLWNQIGTLISATINERQRIAHLNSLASSHLEAADYSLRRLLGELSAVMPIPADRYAGLMQSEVPEVDAAPLRAVLAEAEAQMQPTATAGKARAAAA